MCHQGEGYIVCQMMAPYVQIQGVFLARDKCQLIAQVCGLLQHVGHRWEVVLTE